MGKYIKKFETHNQYTAFTQTDDFILPNVSYCLDQTDIVHYNPIVPMNVITYQATEKLTETTNSTSRGLHTNAFSDTNSQQLTMTSHTFENGVGTIEFDGDIATIGSYAFYSCSSLTSIDIPNNVTRIGGRVFQYCSGLTSVTIGSGVTSIGYNAFDSCSSLTSITSLATTAPTIEYNTFYKVMSGGTLTVPSGSNGYDAWMGTGNHYLGKYNWTKIEQ